MSMTILSNSTGVNGRKDLKVSRTSIKRLLINRIALMTNSSRHSQSSFFIKSSFSEPRWPIAALNHKKTFYYFNNNNCYVCYNRSSVHIIRTVILNIHVTHG